MVDVGTMFYVCSTYIKYDTYACHGRRLLSHPLLAAHSQVVKPEMMMNI